MEGVLQRPQQIHAPGQRGSASLYPIEAVEQLKAICRIKAEERRFDEIRFRLWWEGRWVRTDVLRASIRRILAAELDSFLRAIKGDLLALLEEEVPRSRHPFVRLIRRHVGKDPQDTVAVLYALAQVAAGEKPQWEAPDVGRDEASPGDLTTQAMGFDRAAADSWEGAGPLLEAIPDLREAFAWLPEGGLSGLLVVIDEMSEAELEQARLDGHLVAEHLAVIAEALERVLGRNAFGLGALRLLTQGGRDVWGRRAFLIPGLALVRRSLPAGSFESLRKPVLRAAANARMFLKLPQATRGGGSLAQA